MAKRLTMKVEVIREKMVVLTMKSFFWLEVVVKKITVRAVMSDV